MLSVIMPVHNVETVVAERIHGLLEILSEIAADFELLVIDDGSTDQTEEILHDLVPNYPQLRVLHIDSQASEDHLLQVGFEHTRGEVVMFCDGESPLSSFEIRRLWDLRHDEQLLVANSEPSVRNHLKTSRAVGGDRRHQNMEPSEAPSGIQMIRRSALQRLDPPERMKVLFPKAMFSHRKGRSTPWQHRSHSADR